MHITLTLAQIKTIVAAVSSKAGACAEAENMTTRIEGGGKPLSEVDEFLIKLGRELATIRLRMTQDISEDNTATRENLLREQWSNHQYETELHDLREQLEVAQLENEQLREDYIFEKETLTRLREDLVALQRSWIL